MMTEIGRTTLLVDDYDDAIEFYAETLGFEVLYDDSCDWTNTTSTVVF